MRSEDEDLEPAGAGLDAPCHARADADGVKGRQLDELIVELDSSGAVDDDVDLLRSPMPMGECLALSGLDREEMHPGLLGAEVPPGEASFLVGRKPLLGREVLDVAEVLLRVAHGFERTAGPGVRAICFVARWYVCRVPGNAGFVGRLSGGRRQSIGEADAVAREVEEHPARAKELWEAVSDPDPLVSMRAVDALEKASRSSPGILAGHELEILERLSGSELAEIRWHVGLLVPRLKLGPQALSTAVTVLERLLDDDSRIAQTNALDGLVTLAEHHPEEADRADAAMTRAFESPHASVRARVRRLTR